MIDMCPCNCHEKGEPWCHLCFDTFPHIEKPQARSKIVRGVAWGILFEALILLFLIGL